MPVVAAAVLPHSPLLIPTIARHHAPLFAATTAAVEEIVSDIYAAKPDLIIVLTPHGVSYPGTVVVSSSDSYQANLEEFGDLQTALDASGAPGLTHQLKVVAEREHLPMVLQTFPSLDYGVGVPLYFLRQAKIETPILPISVAHHQPDIILRLGDALHDFLTGQVARAVIIASADFSRRHDRTPGGQRRPTAEERLYSNAIVANDPSLLVGHKPSPDTCGFGPVVALLATLRHQVASGKVQSFSAPLGVGLLTASFSFGHVAR